MRFRRAVSPIIATIILIAITVAAGLLIYTIFHSTAGTLSTQVQVELTSCDLVASDSNALFSVTIKNSGNKALREIKVTLHITPTVKWEIEGTNLEVNPGEYWSDSSSTPPQGATLTPGKSYPAEIYVEAVDGSTFHKALSITCAG
ncbi:MAG: archaellin/type IV pilin N-terminal domain-containing protein [Nitrososphaerota archaeon]